MAAKPSSAAHSKADCSPEPGFHVSSRGKQPVTAQARAWGKCSENDILPSYLLQSPCESQKSPLGGQDYRGGADVQRPYELEGNYEASFPDLQMGKVRPRQNLPKVQDFRTHVAL